MSEEQTSRVLIVDDVPINCVILSSLLASNGVTSDVATGGKECLKLRLTKRCFALDWLRE